MCKIIFQKIALLLLLANFLWVFPACRGQHFDRHLTLAAYTAPREAFREIHEKFTQYWEQTTGEKIEIRASFLGSGAQSRAVLAGFPADVVALSLVPDIDRLVKAGLVSPDWRQNPYRGILTESVVAFAVRQGNPKGITNWDDLLQKDLRVLTPNPKTSGGAQWNILAAYGAAQRGFVPGFEASDQGAKAYLQGLLSQVYAMDKGARESILSFERGLGDVALSYENEILLGRSYGHNYDLVIPRSTILIESPVAVVTKNVQANGNLELVNAYVAFLYSDVASEIFKKNGFRPVSPIGHQDWVAAVPAGPRNDGGGLQKIDIFTAEYFGGWKNISPRFFGEQGIFTLVSESVNRGKQ